METTITPFNILDYTPELKDVFKKLNVEWTRSFKMNPHREALLNEPDELIIKKGGHIFFAEMDNKLVGTCALLRENNKQYEICDMAVTPQYQGKHLGKALLQKTIQKAKELGVKQVYVILNNTLKKAMEMYRAYGFRETAYDPELSIYDGTDVKMVLHLK